MSRRKARDLFTDGAVSVRNAVCAMERLVFKTDLRERETSVFVVVPLI